MKKTALTLAIEKIELDRAEYSSGSVVHMALSLAITRIQSLLPTEHQQIEAAYKDGLTTGHVTGETADKSASDYFKTKYTTP